MDKDRTSALINIIGWIIGTILGIYLLNSASHLNMESAFGNWLLVNNIVLFFFWPIQISYHLLLSRGKKPSLLRRIDRSSMLLLIAAIFTPIFISACPHGAYLALTSILWIIGGAGTVLIILRKDMPRYLAPVIGFIQGIIGIIGTLIYITNLSLIQSLYFATGVIFFLIAGAVYALQKPKFSSESFGFHEFFHTLLAIAIITFQAMYLSIIGGI